MAGVLAIGGALGVATTATAVESGAAVSSRAPSMLPAVAGVPEPPIELYEEDFQNAPVTGATRIANYVTTTGAAYTADPIYLSAPACNGVVFGRAATNAALGAVSFCSSSWWPSARTIPYGMGQYRGFADANQNLAVAEQTGGSGSGSYVGVMLEGTGIPTGATTDGGRFVTFSLDVGNLCSVGVQALDRFYLLDGDDAISLNTADYNVCLDPTRQTFAVDGRVVTVGTFTGDQAALVTSPTVGFRLTNQQPSGSGNDQAFDNFRILDVTPQLDKSFSPMNPVTGESRVTVTVTNTTELGTKAGWSAIDELPDGLVVSDQPDAATTCANGELTAVPGGDSIGIAGDLAGTVVQRTSCTFEVDVVPATATAQGEAPQSFQNCPANFTAVVGLDTPAACAVVTFPSVAQLAITKSTTATSDLVEGEAVTYTVTATNTGGADYTDGVPAVIVDDLADVIDDADYNGDAAADRLGLVALDGSELSWRGALPAGESVTVTYSLTATLGGDGVLGNSACIPAGQASGDACAETVTEVEVAPSIALTKSVSPSAPADFVVDAEVVYTFVVTNTGNLVLDAPTVDEVSFDGTGVLSAITCPPTPALAPGEQMICTADYTVVQGDIDGFSLENPLVNEATAEAVASNGETVTSDLAAAELPAIQSPGVDVVKSAQAGVFDAAGDVVTYEFLVTNTGNVTLADATVDEGEFSGTGELGAVVCPVGAASMAPGAQVTCTAEYTLTQADVDAGSVSNSASADAETPTGDPISSEPSEFEIDIVQSPQIALTKSAGPGGFTRAGQVVEYSFEVENTGNVTVTALEIDEQAFSGTGALGAPVCDDTELAPDDTATCTVDYSLSQADVDANLVTNSATAVASAPVGSVESALSSALVLITPSTAVSLEKTVDREVVAGPGAEVTYSFTVTNTGEATVEDIAIDEESFSGTGDLSAITCPSGPLAPTASLTCTAEYTTTAADVAAGEVTNTASASATSLTGVIAESDPSAAVLTVDPVRAGLAQTGATMSWLLAAWAAGLLVLGAAGVALRLRQVAGR